MGEPAVGATSTPAPPQQLATPSGSQEASILDSSCNQGVSAAAVPLQAATTAAAAASIADLSVMPEFAKIPESALSEVVSELMEAAGTPYYLLTLFLYKAEDPCLVFLHLSLPISLRRTATSQCLKFFEITNFGQPKN